MEPGPPLSGVVGGARQGGWAEGGPGDTVWNIWGPAPSPAINEKSSVSLWVRPCCECCLLQTMSFLTKLPPRLHPGPAFSDHLPHHPPSRHQVSPHFSLKWQKNSPGEECEQVVSMLRYRVAMATAFRLWLHSLVMSSSDAGPTPAPPRVTGARGSKLKTCKVGSMDRGTVRGGISRRHGGQ